MVGRKWRTWKREADHLRRLSDTLNLENLEQERVLADHEARFEAIREALLAGEYKDAFLAAGGDFDTWWGEAAP